MKRKFKEICDPQTNITMERHKFNTRNQKSGESIEAYVSDLRNKARSCKFDALADELIRDRLVCGINNDAVRRLLLRESDLTLSKAVNMCQIHEISEQHSKTLQATASVDAVRSRARSKFNSSNQRQQNRSQRNSTVPAKLITSCNNCGGRHQIRQCPAFG